MFGNERYRRGSEGDGEFSLGAAASVQLPVNGNCNINSFDHQQGNS